MMLLTYIKGMMMGMADLVPGISGGTVALMTGIYQRLITAIAAVDVQSAKLFFQGQFKAFWKSVDGWFLLSVFSGIISAIFLFARLIEYLLNHHLEIVSGLFFGLIIGAAVGIIRHIRGIPVLLAVAFLLLGVLLAALVASGQGLTFISGYGAYFLAGMIAICAMILPGLSGTLILILLGQYQPMLQAVNDREWYILGLFMAGNVVGLMLFSRLLKWLLRLYYQHTMCFLAGLMLGSLVKVWPWQVQQQNIMPWQHTDPQTVWVLLCCLIGAAVVIGFAKFDKEAH
ncbi:DUF368 domain-containing protein [Marinicella sp. W31]|uniref:DUF368 domain-containing protein n=1 Tax=Marinicella sp. W31 TaxID=3023713 RepID=UPI003757B066